MKLRIALAALVTVFVATGALAQKACLRQDQIYNWNAPNDTRRRVNGNVYDA